MLRRVVALRCAAAAAGGDGAGKVCTAEVERRALDACIEHRLQRFFNLEERGRAGAAAEVRGAAVAVRGGVCHLVLAHDGTLSLRNIDCAAAPHVGTAPVLAALRSAAASGSAALHRDTALIKLALRHLPTGAHDRRALVAAVCAAQGRARLRLLSPLTPSSYLAAGGLLPGVDAWPLTKMLRRAPRVLVPARLPTPDQTLFSNAAHLLEGMSNERAGRRAFAAWRWGFNLSACVTGSTLTFGVRGGTLLLGGVAEKEAPEGETRGGKKAFYGSMGVEVKVEGIDNVLAALKRWRREHVALPVADAALVRLVEAELPAVLHGMVTLEAAMDNVAKNIDFAVADEWTGPEAQAGRGAHLDFLKKVANKMALDKVKYKPVKAAAAAVGGRSYEARTTLDGAVPEELQAEGQEVLRAVSQEKKQKANNAAAAKPRSTQSYQEIKRDLAAFMGAGAVVPEETAGFEITGALGDPRTTYRCVACGTGPMFALDLIAHAESPEHLARAAGGSPAEEEALLHALKVQHGFLWHQHGKMVAARALRNKSTGG